MQTVTRYNPLTNEIARDCPVIEFWLWNEYGRWICECPNVANTRVSLPNEDDEGTLMACKHLTFAIINKAKNKKEPSPVRGHNRRSWPGVRIQRVGFASVSI